MDGKTYPYLVKVDTMGYKTFELEFTRTEHRIQEYEKL